MANKMRTYSKVIPTKKSDTNPIMRRVYTTNTSTWLFPQSVRINSGAPKIVRKSRIIKTLIIAQYWNSDIVKSPKAGMIHFKHNDIKTKYIKFSVKFCLAISTTGVKIFFLSEMISASLPVFDATTMPEIVAVKPINFCTIANKAASEIDRKMDAIIIGKWASIIEPRDENPKLIVSNFRSLRNFKPEKKSKYHEEK